MKINVFLNLDKFDEKVMGMSDEQKKELVYYLNEISNLSKVLFKEKKISKIVYNRIGKLWRYSPYQNVSLMPSNKFNELMGIKPVDIRFIYNAVKEVLIKGDKLK